LGRLPVAATVLLSGLLFVVALLVMAGLAGWGTMADQLRFRLSFWFGVAFAAAACAAAIDLLVEGQRKPGLDFSILWATLVPIGAVAAAVGVRHRDRFLGKDGWRGQLGQALEGIRLLFKLAADWRGNWLAFLGASVYWAGDVACLWASLKPFGATPTLPAIVLAHAVGYVLTRRTLPFAGAGIVEVLMPLTLVAAGAPFAGAILGVLVYRIFNLWLPLIPAFAALPTVRRSFKLELSITSAQP
jgi:uncharacterized membrane protein YbhN (UPF0104 family)